jgi:hypothetical protein
MDDFIHGRHRGRENKEHAAVLPCGYCYREEGVASFYKTLHDREF